jgi:hypothetical protein
MTLFLVLEMGWEMGVYEDVPQDSKKRGSVSLTIGKRRRFCA